MNNPFTGGGGQKLQARIAAHVQAWDAFKQAGPAHRQEFLPFITVSRQFGCEALPLADRLVEILNERCRPCIPWVAYDQQVVSRVAEELRLSRAVVESLDGKRRDEMSELFNDILNVKCDEALIIRKIAEVVRSLATHGNAVLVGRGSCLLTQDLKTGLHVRLVAPESWRAHKMACDRNVTPAEGLKIVQDGEKERQAYLRSFFSQAVDQSYCHDLVIDNSRFNLLQIAEIVFAALSARFGEVLMAD